jgi:hypothetical protein
LIHLNHADLLLWIFCILKFILLLPPQDKVTVKNRHPLPLISDLIRTLSEAKIYSALDLRGAYNLVRIKPEDE